MITLTANQPVPECNCVVIRGGDYEPADLVECALADDPEVSICAYQAHYIATGEFA